MHRLETNIEDFLLPYAAVAMKEEAQKIIDEKVEDYRQRVTKAVFESLKNTAIEFTQSMRVNSLKTQLEIVFVDRRTK